MPATRSSAMLRSVTALLALSVATRAIPAGLVEQRDSMGFFDDVLLFDSPAVQSNPSRVQVQVYTYLRQLDIDLGSIAGLFGGLFDGIDLGAIGDKAGNIAERLKLFVSIPRTGKEVELNIAGCGSAKLRATSDEIDGISITDVNCSQTLASSAPLDAKVNLGSRGMTARIFPSPADGFGIISDVDDTIKVSNVLDKLELVKNTFIEEPKAVAGMPQLYASLKTSLNNPFFSYISGSPFQLYPFLDEFIGATYPDGPKFLRNITVFDIPRLIETLSDSNNTFTHKVNTISRLVKLYPAKKFLMIGDSTEADPEIYAEAFKLFPNNVQCIWIRAVDKAANSQERFDKAFANVPKAKTRVFTDAKIAELSQVKVAAGQC